jgi:hypothetical protein
MRMSSFKKKQKKRELSEVFSKIYIYERQMIIWGKKIMSGY